MYFIIDYLIKAHICADASFMVTNLCLLQFNSSQLYSTVDIAIFFTHVTGI